jgi:hypothetical protein
MISIPGLQQVNNPRNDLLGLWIQGTLYIQTHNHNFICFGLPFERSRSKIVKWSMQNLTPENWNGRQLLYTDIEQYKRPYWIPSSFEHHCTAKLGKTRARTQRACRLWLWPLYTKMPICLIHAPIFTCSNTTCSKGEPFFALNVTGAQLRHLFLDYLHYRSSALRHGRHISKHNRNARAHWQECLRVAKAVIIKYRIDK